MTKTKKNGKRKSNMRFGYKDAELLYDGSTFVGVSLGWDHVSEHEHGISDLKRDFGIPHEPTRKVCGFAARQITRVPVNLSLFVDKGTEYLIYQRYNDDKVPHTFVEHKYVEDGFKGAWGSQDFGAALRVDHTIGRQGELKELFQAFQEKNVVFFIGRSGPFSNGGLKICIADRIPEDSLKESKEADLDNLDLNAAVAKTGILAKLKAAQNSQPADRNYNRKCGYYACSPSWRTITETVDGRDLESAAKVMFWLNPQDQENNKAGWYTVEELEQWIEGKGPIPGKRA